MTASRSVVALEGVRKSWRTPGGGEVKALDLDSLVVEQGARLAILGPNGAGKTTLLHVVAGLLRPDAGKVTVLGQRIDRLAEARMDCFRAAHMGYLLHGARLLEGLSAEENVMVALLFAGAPRRKQRERAVEMLERFGVAHRSRHRPHALSAGERQRVALARALANDPALILADEPTSSLDADAAATLVRDLDALCREDGRTLLMVTHHRGEVLEGMDVLRLEKAP